MTRSDSCQTFTLTTGADNLTGSAGNDSFVGVIGTNGLTANGTTFNPGDNLNGGAGTDTLSISVSGTHTGANLTRASITLNAIEKVLYSNFQTDDGFDDILDMSTATGVTTVGTAASSASGDTQFINVKNVVAAEMAGGGDVAVVYASTLLTGTDDSVSLTLGGVGTSAASADFLTWNGAATGVAETLNVASTSAANFVTINGNNDHKTIVVTGDQNLSITNTLDTTVTKVDASALTGRLSVTAGVSAINLTGGAGDDTINMAATLGATDTVNGGAGNDTVAISDPTTLTATTGARLSNFEILRADSGSGTAYAASAIAGLTRVVANHNTNDTVTISGMGASTALQLTNTLAGSNDNVTASLATNTTADAITVTIGATTATSGTGSAAGTVNLDNYETVTVTSTGGTAAAANSIAALTSSSATKVVVTGDRALTLTAFTNSGINLKTLDASALTANLNMVAALTGSGTTLTGGAGNDTLTGSTGADSVNGGAGNDRLDGSNGNDSLSGGDGNDSVTGGTGNDVITGDAGDDTIVGAAGNDNLSGGDGNDTFTINTWSDITAVDTIDGGAGTDTVSTTDTTVTLNSAATGGLRNLESITIAGNATTVTITDVGIGSFNNDITIRDTSNNGHTVNASGVLSSTSKVTFTGGTGGDTYNVGNGIDNASTGAGNDTVSVATVAYLGTSDSIDGGAGTGDVLAISEQVAATTTISAAQMANVKGFETISFDTNGAAAGTGNYVLTLTDAILANNNNAGALTVSRGSQTTNPDTGTLRIDGSGVAAGYSLTLTGAAGADTLIGGAGNDTISGGTGVDSLTGGAGNDTFRAIASNGVDIVTDMNFGTSTTTVDRLDFAALTLSFTQGAAGTFDTITLQSAAYAASTDVLVLNLQAYADITAVDGAIEAWSTANSGANRDFLVVWQDTFGTVHVAAAVGADGGNAGADGGDEYTTTDYFNLSGLTLAGISSLLNTGDFVVA